ncbi:hypothetical protein LHJ74_03280 [Streptomyces sp. N2-109]|uniref:Uncharacterized protein n=1 Tax=Streptomyces gossypii TaxID=2883101 RepID=A0ABT2JM56_9ACTN|nr:hypothetical protein [Streptomyces gossypii]MCT2588966.1 hypothetical protein [Streptomyces gossypii]
MSLPAADELFRTTGGSAVQPSAPQQQGGEPRVPAPAGEPARERTGENRETGEHTTADDGENTSADAPTDAATPADGTGEHYGREQRSGAPASVPGQDSGPSAGRQGRNAAPGVAGGAAGNDASGSAAYAQDQQDARRPISGRGAQAAASPRGGQAKGRQGTGGSGSRRSRAANRRPSGRERHDEKITVYVSAEELMDLEHARLVLRGEHGLAVDRGRIVREAVAVVLADLESRGDASILVRRLRGR